MILFIEVVNNSKYSYSKNRGIITSIGDRMESTDKFLFRIIASIKIINTFSGKK